LTKLDGTGIRQVADTRLGVLMLTLLGAFGQEIAGLRRKMAVEEVIAGPGCSVYRGKLESRDCLLVRTGMGKERAENATRLVLQRYPVTAMISLGFAGALSPELTIGDVVVCSTMHCASGPEKRDGESEAYHADANLLALASQGAGAGTIRFRLGSGVTVTRLASSTQKMQALGRGFHADIVDMESYWIARIASARQVPFIAIRSISDTMRQGVQPFDRILTSDGRLLWKRAALGFLLHPGYLMNVFTLFKNTRHAERNLTAFISELVARI
jgi:adenosylhomocysteine nucleosidase